MFMSMVNILLMLGVVCLGGCYMLFKKRRFARHLPPSPKPHPLFGHLFSLPASNQHLAYMDIGKKLNSDIISFSVFGHVLVVLNSIESATELLTKRTMNYSDPIEIPMMTDERLLGWGKETISSRYTERWKKQRKLTHAALQPSASQDLRSTMVKQARASVRRLLDNPENLGPEVEWLTAANILASVYGYQPSYPSDNLINIVTTAAIGLGEAAKAGNFYVNVLPWLKYVPSWLPGAEWKRKAEQWRFEKDQMINEPYEWTKAQMANGTASPSILKTLLTNLENKEALQPDLEEEMGVILWATGSLFAAGAETILAAIKTFALAMVLYPEIQRKAQAELDRYLGDDKLPELCDREELPYINRILKEVLRWNSVASLGIPRTCSQDDTYKGYTIPKGSIVIGNVWAMCHDPSIYAEPHTFNPDRFLDSSVPNIPAFGFGRRVCPGSHFGESSLFLLATTLLTVFDIKPVGGKPIPQASFNMNGLASHPDPFSCTLIVRSEKRRQLMEEWVGN